MSVNRWNFLTAALLGMFLCLPSVAAETDVVDSFRDHVQSLDVKDSQKSLAEESIDAFSEDSPGEAITAGLIAIYPEYGTAIDSSEVDDSEKTVKLLKPLTESADKFLAADSSFFLARTLMNEEQFESALPLLESLKKNYADHTMHTGTSDYYLGVAHAGLLENQKAIDSFVEFLDSNPDAPERMRVSAWRQVQGLQTIEEGKLDDVHQRMEYSRRRLDLEKTDDPTQVEQEKVVTMLTKLIKEAEKKECSGSCKNCNKPGENKPSAGKKPQQASKKPQQKKSESGKNAKAADGKAVVKTYEDTPASPWSRLRDRSRDPANNAIKEKLPAKYRDIVEKYMEKANGEPSGQ
ncbi:tetratricopeptide repeat protein [Mariniblastus fucicola]|uniref:Outer membrane protein assembly factor BamD n=1 Tax=Mariniblastus fucicola TaxID=980251 RepID=A0A5B9PCJ6_9BACT|nr:tetratricopeptide repeat protein [Mariniblastus fucicola]QEG20831.1 hypothetical protein MFFC18_06820 [Mariniblastus fucicola]